MRFFHTSPCSLLMCTLLVLVRVELHGVQAVAIENDLAGSHSACHLDLPASDLAPGSVGSELTSDQIEGVATGKQCVDKISAPLAEDVDQEKPRVKSALETRTWEHYIKTLEDFKNWSSELFTFGMTPAEKANVSKQLEIAKQALNNLFQARLHCLRGKCYKDQVGPIPADNFQVIINSLKPIWLDSVFQIMQILPKEKGKLTNKTFDTGYDLMVTLLINVLELELLFEDQLSQFLNNNQNAQLILSHVTDRLESYDSGEGFLYPKFYVWKFIDDVPSTERVEAQLLKFLDRKNRIKVTFDFLVGTILDLTRQLPDQVWRMQKIASQFFEYAFLENMEISKDEILSFEKSLHNHYQSNFGGYRDFLSAGSSSVVVDQKSFQKIDRKEFQNKFHLGLLKTIIDHLTPHLHKGHNIKIIKFLNEKIQKISSELTNT